MIPSSNVQSNNSERIRSHEKALSFQNEDRFDQKKRDSYKMVKKICHWTSDATGLDDTMSDGVDQRTFYYSMFEYIIIIFKEASKWRAR